MSYGIMLYGIDPQKLTHLEGCKDQALFDDIISANTSTIDDNTSWFDHYESLVTLDQALHHVMFDEPKNDRFGFQYGYAYKMACEHFGHSLNNSAFYPIDLQWSNDQLEEAGLKSFDLYDLAYGSPLWNVPSPDDFPGIGQLSRAQLDALRKETFTLTAPEGADRWVEDALWNIRAWVSHLRANEIIVGFYH